MKIRTRPTSLPQSYTSLLQKYNSLVDQHVIKDDPHQRKTLTQLEKVNHALATYKPPSQSSWTKWLWPRKQAPRGIYMYGGVGCGKTMLMDMFIATVPPHLTHRRLHYDQFIINVHKEAHQSLITHGSRHDPIPELVAHIAASSHILCLDEFQVVNVADAMLMRRLFEALVLPPHSVVLYMTSNRHPRDLYKNGIQRASFIPCIELIERHCHVVELSSSIDYRSATNSKSRCFYTPPPNASLSDFAIEAKRHVDKWFHLWSHPQSPQTTSSHPQSPQTTSSNPQSPQTTSSTSTNPPLYNLALPVWGRALVVPKYSPKRVAQFSFHQLCEQPLDAADYIALTHEFPCLIITDIPKLSLDNKDALRRFITLIDAAYESHTKLAVTSECPFKCLFPTSHHSSDSILHAAGEEISFALKRAVSRLDQMGSDAWLQQTGRSANNRFTN